MPISDPLSLMTPTADDTIEEIEDDDTIEEISSYYFDTFLFKKDDCYSTFSVQYLLRVLS